MSKNESMIRLMKKQLLSTILLLVLLLALAVGPAGAQGTISTTTLNFQGELLDGNGTPLNGTYNMRFAIYDAGQGGSKVWPATANHEEHAVVTVTAGLFNILLGSQGQPLDTDHFLGNDRYLQVWVCQTAGSGCSNYEALSPRQPIVSVAYALSARTLIVPVALEATSSDDLLAVNNKGTGRAVYAETAGTSQASIYGKASATAANATAAGVVGESDAPNGAGVSGFADHQTGVNYGVYGQTSSSHSDASGVYGRATSGSATAVFGYSTGSSDASGVYGLAGENGGRTYGVFGQTKSSTDNSTGVTGKASASSGAVYGVLGATNSADANASGVYGYNLAGQGKGVWGWSAFGTGVYGEADTTGKVGVHGKNPNNSNGSKAVWGQATGSSGQVYGVYGESDSTNGYGLYSKGNAHVDGELTWQAKTSYLSISPPEFAPWQSNRYYLDEKYVECYGGCGGSMPFLAPVELPHGATVTSLKFYWKDKMSNNDINGIKDGTVYLKRSGVSSGGSMQLMAMASTSGSSGTVSNSQDTTITYPLIDNANYFYTLYLTLPKTNYDLLFDPPPPTPEYVRAYGVVIEYTVSTPY